MSRYAHTHNPGVPRALASWESARIGEVQDDPCPVPVRLEQDAECEPSTCVHGGVAYRKDVDLYRRLHWGPRKWHYLLRRQAQRYWFSSDRKSTRLNSS